MNQDSQKLSDQFTEAMIHGHYDTMNKLNQIDMKGFNPQSLLNKYLLFCAITRGDIHEIKHLSNQGYQSTTPENTLINSCYDGDIVMTQFLIEKQKLPLEKIGFQLVEAVVISVLNNNIAEKLNIQLNMIELLHNNGVNIHAQNDTLFKLCVQKNAPTDLLALFVNLGSNIDYVLKNGTDNQKKWAIDFNQTITPINSSIETLNSHILKKLKTLK